MAINDIGGNYAAAFIESMKTAEEIDRGSQDLASFIGVLDELPALARVLDNPGMSLERRQAILDEVAGLIDAQTSTKRLLHLIVEKGRVPQLKEIAARFAELRESRLGEAGAEVVTAVALDGGSRAEWERALSRLSGRKVTITYRTDAALIGGALARVGSTVYDGSIQGQLASIRGILLREHGEHGEHGE